MTFRIIAILMIIFGLAGCAVTSDPGLRRLAKTDIDLVTDAYIDEQEALCRELTIKLYKRNPLELQRQPGMTINRRMQQLFQRPRALRFTELNSETGTNAIELALNDDFHGDRVFALMTGITSMLDASYGGRTEYFMLDSLSADRLTKSARNLEIVLWRLKHRGPSTDSPWLLTNSLDPEQPNLSFERLFGKMIALQDMMATISNGGEQRNINRVVQGIASAALFPLGI
ncbi:hypothetical protein C4K68_03040 [Pokkaliibacter plantistimulans]|uniref:Lipoprotein n=1 Tax=Proteobacteria bacterium 228 TaxID=2083153 RepID=A0A2S5KW13_9PROT|nr:hypothetical protein C4K68_03040 [Pokkaliibacter plantistimulans]